MLDTLDSVMLLACAALVGALIGLVARSWEERP